LLIFLSERVAGGAADAKRMVRAVKWLTLANSIYHYPSTTSRSDGIFNTKVADYRG
jgi:hypothetical protein